MNVADSIAGRFGIAVLRFGPPHIHQRGLLDEGPVALPFTLDLTTQPGVVDRW